MTSSYNATSSRLRFGIKNYLSTYFEKRSSTLFMNIAGVVVVNSKVVGLAPGMKRKDFK
jgi:hypothetical protein